MSAPNLVIPIPRTLVRATIQVVQSYFEIRQCEYNGEIQRKLLTDLNFKMPEKTEKITKKTLDKAVDLLNFITHQIQELHYVVVLQSRCSAHDKTLQNLRLTEAQAQENIKENFFALMKLHPSLAKDLSRRHKFLEVLASKLFRKDDPQSVGIVEYTDEAYKRRIIRIIQLEWSRLYRRHQGVRANARGIVVTLNRFMPLEETFEISAGPRHVLRQRSRDYLKEKDERIEQNQNLNSTDTNSVSDSQERTQEEEEEEEEEEEFLSNVVPPIKVKSRRS